MDLSEINKIIKRIEEMEPEYELETWENGTQILRAECGDYNIKWTHGHDRTASRSFVGRPLRIDAEVHEIDSGIRVANIFQTNSGEDYKNYYILLDYFKKLVALTNEARRRQTLRNAEKRLASRNEAVDKFWNKDK